MLRKVRENLARRFPWRQERNLFEPGLFCCRNLLNDLLWCPDQTYASNRFGGDEASLFRHEIRAVAIMNLQVPFLLGRFHLVDKRTVFVPNSPKRFGNAVLVAGLFINLVYKMNSGCDLRTTLVNDTV